MKAVPRIKTYSYKRRIWRYMERSWFPLFAIVTAIVVMAANFPD